MHEKLCSICGHAGHDEATCFGMRQLLPANRAGLASRKTFKGIHAAVERALTGFMHRGETAPCVILYVRPGALPKIKITVELQEG